MKVGLNNTLDCKTPRLIIFLLTAILLLGGFSIIGNAYAQKAKNTNKKSDESFVRPKPRQPMKPTIPKVNRYQNNKVFLEKADSLYRPQFDYDEKQVVKGGVVFRQGGMWMMCDSAYYFPTKNSLNAFGHVEMKQGDTLFVYADKLFYNGADRRAFLVKGPSRKDVKLKNRKVTLTTDSLDYDLNMDLGWYSTGGHLTDGVNDLTSIRGQYSPSTKIADFSDNVLLINKKDGYRLTTEELQYNTQTHIANISTETLIEGKTDTIITFGGRYNTVTDHAVLTERSKILHRDSAQNVVTIEGDSLIYDKKTRISRAYMFKSPGKTGRPVVMTDTAHRVILYGGFAQYNDSLQRGFSTDYPLLVEYSKSDTLFMRADTIMTNVRVEMVWPDSLKHEWNAATRERLKKFKSIQQIGDSMYVELNLLPYGFPYPGDAIREMYMSPNLNSGALQASKQGAAKANTQSNKKVLNPRLLTSNDEGQDSEGESNETIVSSESVPLKRRLDKFERDSAYMIPKDFYTASAIGKARFFKQDMQGIADTINYQQFDSMLYLIRKPIVWSGERQVSGKRINVHLMDSTVDVAYLPQGGFLAEHIEEDFYNQLSGKSMTAYFNGSELERVEVDGNVETIFLPQENDSTFNRLIHAESSYLTIALNARKLEKIKMWPEVSGSVTPLFLVKKNQQFLPGFAWYEFLRPERAWYGNQVKWIDALGEVPESLEQYFMKENE